MDITCSGNPVISGTVRPIGDLSAFNGESTLGNWTLEVSDTAPGDGGALQTFSLEICVEGDFRPDADGDGVLMMGTISAWALHKALKLMQRDVLSIVCLRITSWSRLKAKLVEEIMMASFKSLPPILH